MPVSAFAQQSEYTIKAVFLEHFTRFIEWPESSGIEDTSSAFVIEVIGENPFGSILEEIYAEQKIKNKRAEIRYISTPDEISDCHILFISKSAKSILPDILSCTRNRPILTVSDTEGFAQKRVLINFYLSGDNIKFEINEKAVHESGLVMSYKLLNLARIVNPVRIRK
ncbi:MAG: YfiR family protein [Thermoplasmata archaeon]|nr:MAG: YfiR family protein [Thermoplasmata archaeon]